MNNEKLIKSARVIDRILKIIQGFMVAGIIVSAVFIPLTIVLGDKVIASSNNLGIGSLDLKLADVSYLNDSNVTASIIVTLAVAIVACGIGWYGLKIMRSIMLPMKEGRPFEMGISEKVRKLAWVALVGGGICEIGRAVAGVCELKMYDLSTLFNPTTVLDYSVSISINGSFIVLAVVLFVLSYVFRYGEELQKESDETL